MLHNLADLDLNPQAAKFSAVVFGHSHKPEYYFKDEVLYFNPEAQAHGDFRSQSA
jgi:predicted phosphodiesterase